jgi:hypothetical protein
MNVSGGLPNPGKTYHGGTPDSIGRSVDLEGTECNFKDEIRVGAQPRQMRSGRFRTARLVRNTSGFALEPKRLVSWAAGFRGLRVAGYARLDGQEVAGVVDPDLPASGVANNDLFWLFRKGPNLVKTPLAGGAGNVFDEGEILGALTAATSGAATAGRLGKVATGTTATLPSVVVNRIGRALSAATTANTNADLLVDINILD